jgi:hypothetical protein
MENELNVCKETSTGCEWEKERVYSGLGRRTFNVSDTTRELMSKAKIRRVCLIDWDGVEHWFDNITKAAANFGVARSTFSYSMNTLGAFYSEGRYLVTMEVKRG